MLLAIHIRICTRWLRSCGDADAWDAIWSSGIKFPNAATTEPATTYSDRNVRCYSLANGVCEKTLSLFPRLYINFPQSQIKNKDKALMKEVAAFAEEDADQVRHQRANVFKGDHKG